MSVVKRYKYDPTTVQALAESLNRQGWITYPRVDAEKAQNENEGIKLLRDINEFSGSQEERHILEVIENANKSLSQGLPYVIHGSWKLSLGDYEILSKQEIIFAGEESSFTDKQFDLDVKKVGVNNEDMTRYLINNKIGTPATRTVQMSELKQAGIISIKTENNEAIYTGDQRAIYMKVAMDYLDDNVFSSGLNMSRSITSSDSLDNIQGQLDLYEPIDINDFSNHIKIKVQDHREAEKDLRQIEMM